MSTRTVFSLLIPILLFVAGCGGDQTASGPSTDFNGQDYFRGALLGYGPAANSSLAQDSFARIGDSLDETELEKLIHGYEDVIVRMEEIDSGFFDRFEKAAESGDRVHLLRLLDEASLLLMVSAPVSDAHILAVQDEAVGQMKNAGGIAALDHDVVLELIRAMASEMEVAAKTEIEEIEPSDVGKTIAIAYIVPLPPVPPTCHVVTYVNCFVVVYYSIDLTVVANGSAETDLQREQLVDDLVRLAN